MKSTLLSAALFLSAPLVMAADGPLKAKALELSSTYQDSVLFLTAVVEIELTAGSNPVKKEERKVETLGTVIGKDGLIVVPLSTLDVASTIDGRTVNGPQGPIKISAKGTTKEVKILMPDGTEIEAKVATKDPDLDLAFIRPEKPEDVKLTAVDTANNSAMALMEDVIVLGRLGKSLKRNPVVRTSEVISIIKKPRTFGKIGSQCLGMPVFNQQGKFLGIGINRFGAKGDGQANGIAGANVVLPAKDLLESASQAK